MLDNFTGFVKGFMWMMFHSMHGKKFRAKLNLFLQLSAKTISSFRLFIIEIEIGKIITKILNPFEA
jgi:hypothetical protein